MRVIIKNYFIYALLILFAFSCGILSNKDKDKKTKQYLQYLLFGLVDNGENTAKLFYISPLIKSGSSLDLDFVVEATSANVTLGKKKLVLVHGWDFNDRDSRGFTFSEQRGRIITDSWADFISSSTFDGIVTTANYDVYAFDYLTSNSIEANGRRFRTRMDALFGSESGTVVIAAHSMGGLISRFAVYEDTRPAYLNRIITMGTPFHGSPWASPEYQADKGTIGSIAGFMTDTTGGRDLAWDNFDGKISGATNAKLTNINAKTDRDDFFYAYYGSVNSSGTRGAGGSVPGLYLACPVLGSNFAPSDCIVPSTSASLSGNTLTVRDIGAYAHLDLKLYICSTQVTFYGDLPP